MASRHRTRWRLERSPGRFDDIRRLAARGPTDRQLVFAAWLVAILATLGSLTYSNVLGFTPCHLCWYQRIFMYPLTLVLGFAFLTRRADLVALVLAFTIPGGALAAYHSALQLAPTAQCSTLACSTVSLRVLGLSIPNQSLLAFGLISLAMGWLRLAGGATDG